MSKDKLLIKYEKDVKELRNRAKSYNLTENEVNEIFKSCFEELRNEISSNCCVRRRKAQNLCFRIFRTSLGLLVLLVVFYVVLNVHQPTTSIVLRNVQGLIYPSLRIVRYLSVPIIARFPALTELYDESCLVENPFFHVYDMECWPCGNVHSVMDLTGFNNHSLYQSGIPYIVKTKQKRITFDIIKQLYINHTSIFDKDASRLKSSDPKLSSIKDIANHTLNNSQSSPTHISWRINRMTPARLIRALFPKPLMVSEWSGQSVERYIMIDEPGAETYTLPSFECSYVFVIQGSGQRTIILKPSKECSRDCRTISIVLKPSYVLWYNWWYWRPISLPVVNSTEPSVSYISSYC